MANMTTQLSILPHGGRQHLSKDVGTPCCTDSGELQPDGDPGARCATATVNVPVISRRWARTQGLWDQACMPLTCFRNSIGWTARLATSQRRMRSPTGRALFVPTPPTPGLTVPPADGTWRTPVQIFERDGSGPGALQLETPIRMFGRSRTGLGQVDVDRGHRWPAEGL